MEQLSLFLDLPAASPASKPAPKQGSSAAVPIASATPELAARDFTKPQRVSPQFPKASQFPLPSAEGAMAFARVFRRMRLKQPAPEFMVHYHPFAGLRSTVSLRDQRLHARISDLLKGSPPIIFEALAEILLAKLYRRRVSDEARECYMAFVLKDDTRARVEEARRLRGRKIQRPAPGWFYNLAEVFADLNQRFFGGRLSPPRIGWSPVRSRTILGHYDSAHHSITISRLLDSDRVPRVVVEYVMFHEMLHIEYPVERNGPRRVVHSREFQEAERRFPGYKKACNLLKRISSGRLE